MESTHIPTANGNLAEYFVSYGGEENSELIMQTGSSSSEGIYISTPPDIRVEHVSVDKDGNLILQTTSSRTDGKACDQTQGIGSTAQPLYASLPSTSQALPSENTFIAYKDGIVVEENKELLLAESATNSDEKIFLLQPNAAKNLNVVLANAVNNAAVTALRQPNENIVLNIITEDGQKLENVILAQNVGEPLDMKPKPNLDTFSLPDGLGRNSQQMVQSYSKPVTSEKTRAYPGRRTSGRGKGRNTYVPQPVLREFQMEKKLEMLSNFQELVMTSQSKIKPSTSKLSANCSRSDVVKAVNTDQNTIILTRSQPQQSLLQHPITGTLPASSTEMPTSVSVAKPSKSPMVPKLVTTPIIMKTSELKGMSHKALQQLVSKSVPQGSTKMNPTAKTEAGKKASSQMSTIVVIVPPCTKWGTMAADIDAKEKPLLENPSIMFSQNSSSSRTMLYEIPAKIIKFQEDRPLQRRLPFRHQDYLKVTKIQNEGEPIRPPGRFYKSRGSKKSVQISIPVVEKLPDEKGTKIVNSAQQLMSMYPLLSSRLPQIAKLVDSSNMGIPQSILGTESDKCELTAGQQEILQDHSLPSHQKLELQVTDMKTNVVSKDIHRIGKQLKGNTAVSITDNPPSFCHSNVLRTYQELRSFSHKGKSSSPFKMGTKNLKQNCQTSTSDISAQTNSKPTNIEISQVVQEERQDQHHKMKSVALESVLKHLEIASPDDSATPAVASDDAVERYSSASQKESADSLLPEPYPNKQHCQPDTAAISNADVNLISPTEIKTEVISDHSFQKKNDLQLLPHSENEKNTENSIQPNQSSVNIDNLLTPQTSLNTKYDVQTSVARNLSAGLKTLDLDSFLALSTDDDEVGRDGSLVSKDQDTLSKQDQLQVHHSSSKPEMVCRLAEQFPEGVLYIEEPASPMTEEPTCDSNMKLEESSPMTSDITQHTKELNVHSEGEIVCEVPDNDDRNLTQTSTCLNNDALETKSVDTISSENLIGLDCEMSQTASMDSTQKLKLLSHESVQETDLQMQDLSKDSNLEDVNGSELATKSSEALEQIEVSGCGTEVIEKPSKSIKSDYKKTTVSTEGGLAEQKTILSHDSLDMSNTQHDTSLQCTDILNVTSANVTEINKEVKGAVVDFQTVLQTPSDTAEATNASLVNSEQKTNETHLSDVLTFQQPDTNVQIENIGNNYEAERTISQEHTSICSSEQLFPSETFCNKESNAVGESELENELLPSEMSDLKLASDIDFRKETPSNANAHCLTSDITEEKLHKTSSLKNKTVSEMHFTKAGNSSLLDEVTALQKPLLLQAMLTDETGSEITDIATALDEISNKTKHSSSNNTASVNSEELSHSDNEAKPEKHCIKTDKSLQSFVTGESYSKQDDDIRTSTTGVDNVVNNAKLNASLECKTLHSQVDEESLKVSTESPDLDTSKKETLLVPDPHTEKEPNETVIGSPCASSDVDSKETSADPLAVTDLVTDDQPETSRSNVIFQGEDEHGHTKTDTSEHANPSSIPVPSAINSCTNEKLSTSDVRNETSCISSENYSNVAPLSPNVGILTGLNMLPSKEATSAGTQGSNLSNINFINLLQPSKKINPSGVSNSHLLNYTNTVLLLPAINTQGSNVEYLNPAVVVRNELNVTEKSTSADALNLGNQIKKNNEAYTDFNKNNQHSLHQSAKKCIEPCEKVQYQLPRFVFAGEEALSSLKGQMMLSAQSSKDMTNVSPGCALQNTTEKVTEELTKCAAQNNLCKISDVEAPSNICFNSSSTFALELLNGNDKEAEIPNVETAPRTTKQVGRERRRRKQSLEELRLPEEFMKMEVLALQDESPVKKKRRYRKHNRTLAVDVKKELESSEQGSDYCGDTDAKLKKDESDKNGHTISKGVDSSDLSASLKEVSESFANEGSSITKLNEDSEESLLISNKSIENLKNDQHLQTRITNNAAEGEAAVHHSQKLSLGSKDEDTKAKGSEMKEEALSPKITKLVDVNVKERGSHLKRRLFKQLSSEDLLKKNEKKSKRILSKAKSLDHELLSAEEVAISTVEHDQHKSGEADGAGTSSEFVSQSARGSHNKESAEKIEEGGDVENENQKISSVKSATPWLEQAIQSKITDSKDKKAGPEKQLSKVKGKGLKESIKHITRRTSLKHKLMKKDDSSGKSSKSVTASGKSSSPIEKKEQRTARIIRELRKRMTPRYRKQESLDSVSKKENLKTNTKKQKTETKTNTSLIMAESQRKKRSEQDNKKLRRSARQYIKQKIIEIKKSLRMKNQGSRYDTASLSTRKRISSVEEGMDSVSGQKQKIKVLSNDRKKCPNKIIKSKSDKRKKFSSSGRQSLHRQRSSSPEYPIAIPVPQDTHCVQKEENKDLQTRALDDEAQITDNSELNPVSTDIRKECLQNECVVKADVANLKYSTEIKISSVEEAPSTEEETRAVTVEESEKKVNISVKDDEITECSEMSRCKANIVVNVTSGNTEEVRMENENTKNVTNVKNEITDTRKLDGHIVSSDVQVDEVSKTVPNTNGEAANSSEMPKPGDVKAESEKLETSVSPKAEKEAKLVEVPKKKFFKHREPGQMRNKRFTCIFNVEENEKELLESAIKTEKSTINVLEGPLRDTEQYRIYRKRSLEMANYDLTESGTDNVERPLQVESHMLDLGINLPEIPDITFIAPSETKWPLAAKEMKCYMGKRRRLLNDDEEEEEEEEEKQEVKEEPQEELEFQSSRWPETTRKRCYPGKRTPKFSQEYHSCSFLQKKSHERSLLRSYGKSKTLNSPQGGTDKTLLQFKEDSPKILSKYAAMEDVRQQKCSSLDDEGKQVSTSCVRKQVDADSHSGKKEAEQRFNLPAHLLGRNIGDPASDPTERKSPLQQPRIGVRVPYRNLTSQIVSSQEIVREILERSRVRSTAIAMAMNKRVADAVDRSFSKRLNASLARLPMPSGPEELEAALQATAGTKLKLLPQDKERNWHVGLPGVIGSSATTTVPTIKPSSNYAGSKSGTRSRSSTRGTQGSGLYLEKESEREIALRQLETLPSRCKSSRRQTESAVKVTKPKKLDWCKQRSRRKQSK